MFFWSICCYPSYSFDVTIEILEILEKSSVLNNVIVNMNLGQRQTAIDKSTYKARKMHMGNTVRVV